MVVKVSEIRQAIRSLGLSGCPVCIHSSLRSFGFVEGGASAVINGFLDEGCTLLVPTFSWAFAVPPPAGNHIVRNAYAYDHMTSVAEAGRVFSPNTNEIDRDMGAIPAEVLRTEGRARGNHPICSFAAVGPMAKELIPGQTASNVYAPLEALAHVGGYIIMMGVGLNKLTLIHLAEQKSGRNLFIRWASDPSGEPARTEVGGCSSGFGKLEPALASLEQDMYVGASLWKVFPTVDALDALTKAIRENPSITHCGDPNCGRCEDSIAGGPIC